MPHRAVGRYIREHIAITFAVLIFAGFVATAYGLIREAQLNDRIIEARQHDCESGNVVRGHIQFVTSALHDLLVLSLAAPPRPNETAGQRLLRRNFQEITDRLGERLPALAPRDCSRSGVTGAGAAPGVP